MVGTYIRDTFDEIQQLLIDFNAALSAQGLDELTDINDMFLKQGIHKRPYMLVGLTQRKESMVRCQDQTYDVEENVPLDCEVYVRGNQRDAILYEGVVKSFIKGKEDYLREKITDAYLVTVHPAWSEVMIDTEKHNADGWKVIVRFVFKYSWS